MEKKFNNTKVLPVNYDPVAINQSSINLKMEIFRLKHEIDNYKMVQLLQEPFVSKFPVKPNNRQIIVLAGIVGLMLGVFLVFIMEYFEEIRKNFK
jgi:capsular polysaccharide biosynthesis protein